MPMTFGEQILSGVVLALGGGLIGRVTSMMTFNRICQERQGNCTKHMCVELAEIKEAQKTMQEDIKKLLAKGV